MTLHDLNSLQMTRCISVFNYYSECVFNVSYRLLVSFLSDFILVTLFWFLTKLRYQIGRFHTAHPGNVAVKKNFHVHGLNFKWVVEGQVVPGPRENVE
jgi:hypothetical protein